MQLEITIDDENGTPVAHNVEVKTRDLVAFERKYETSFDGISEETFKAEYLFFLAWNVCRRTKITELDFDSWLDIADVTGEAEEVPLASSAASL